MRSRSPLRPPPVPGRDAGEEVTTGGASAGWSQPHRHVGTRRGTWRLQEGHVQTN